MTRLNNWALWHARGGSGGALGFASQAAFLNEAPGSGGSREARVPVDEVDAGVTDQAVSSLKLDFSHLHDTLCWIYLSDLGVKEAARAAGCAESTIHARLAQADGKLATWFTERKRVQEAKRAALNEALAKQGAAP